MKRPLHLAQYLLFDQNATDMPLLSPHFSRLSRPYLFPVIEEKLYQFRRKHGNVPILNLGVGDVSLPLAKTIGDAIATAAQQMCLSPRGYGPSEGDYELRHTICLKEYAQYGRTFDEVFISDGTNTDVTAIFDLFAEKATALLIDPAYPAYLDAALLSGKEILLVSASIEDGFAPSPPKEGADLAILCTPSNPTGVGFSRECLRKWVAWALKHRAFIFIDNVYEAFITSKDTPKSIYEIDGAEKVAIELRSFSKKSGFTALRCGYMVIPKTLHADLHKYWKIRINIRSNGVSYPIQRGALATFSEEGSTEVQAQIDTYKESAQILRHALKHLGESFVGGIDAPYIFWKCPEGKGSWDFCDFLLEQSHLLSIPGVGFGPSGEGFVRLSCLITPHIAKEASHALQYLYRTK